MILYHKLLSAPLFQLPCEKAVPGVLYYFFPPCGLRAVLRSTAFKNNEQSGGQSQVVQHAERILSVGIP